MDREERFHEMVAQLHAAALDAKLWEHALGEMVMLLDVRAAHFFLWNANAGRVDFSICESPRDYADEIASALASYTGYYASIDYRRELTNSTEPGSWMHCHSRTTPRHLAQNAFFQEFLKPANLRWLSGLRVPHEGGRVAYFGLSRGFDQHPIDGHDLRLVEHLTRHLLVASRNFFSAAHLRLAAQQGLDGLHAWPEALVILDGQSRVRFVNGAGERFLRGSRALYVRRGGLVASKDARLRQQLQNAIRRAVAEGISSTFPLHSEESANPWTITVLPLPREQASEIRWLERSALVIIGGVAREPRANALGRLLGLSPREAELALALLRGEVPSAIADRRGVALTTVRSQIRSLFTKTGVNRISALVRLVSSLTASPSVSEE